ELLGRGLPLPADPRQRVLAALGRPEPLPGAHELRGVGPLLRLQVQLVVGRRAARGPAGLGALHADGALVRRPRGRQGPRLATAAQVGGRAPAQPLLEGARRVPGLRPRAPQHGAREQVHLMKTPRLPRLSRTCTYCWVCTLITLALALSLAASRM